MDLNSVLVYEAQTKPTLVDNGTLLLKKKNKTLLEGPN